jgi:hypothetical protein
MKYKQHPLSAAFPGLGEEEFRALTDDIDANGVREKIVIYDGMILDGWHRYSACMELSVKKPPLIEYEGDDPVGFVLSKNLHRRHLDASQRAFAIAQLSEWQEKSGRPSHNLERIKSGKITGLSADEAAELAGVSEKTMRQARAATKAILEVQAAVTKGEIAVSEAAKLAKLPLEEQRAAVLMKRDPKFYKSKMLKVPDEETVPLSEYRSLQDKYDDLSSNYQALAAELDACEAIRNGEQMDHFKKLNQQLIVITASRDEFQNKCGELTRQVNYLNGKLKKTKE